MRDLISNSKRQDEAWRNKRRENGKKGGRPRKTSANEENQKNLEVIEENQKNLEVIEENQKNLEVIEENKKNLEDIEENQKNLEVIEENQKNHNDNVNENDNEKEKKEGKETSEETNRETDKVQEAPFFLDSESSEEEEGDEYINGVLERALGSLHGEPPFDAAAPPSRSNAGVSDAPESRPQAQDFASWFEGLRLYWNKVFPERPYKKTADCLSYGKREDLMGTWRAWGAADCKLAVDSYKKARDSPDLYDLKGCEYPSGFTGFLKSGVDAFAGEGAPDQFLRRTKEAARKAGRVRLEEARKEFDAGHGEFVRLYKEALERGCGAEAARILALDEEARLSFERRMEEVEKEAD
jgi:hypothetical protein